MRSASLIVRESSAARRDDSHHLYKASHELALTLVRDLKKGTAFVVEGQISHFKHPDTNRESYSIWAPCSRSSKLSPTACTQLRIPAGSIGELSYKSFETRIGYWVAMRNPDCWHPLQALRWRIAYEELAKKGRGGIE